MVFNFELNPHPEIFLKTDELYLKYLLYEIFYNSIIYNKPEGYIRMNSTFSGGFLDIIIEDTGIGIGPEQLDKVTERFYRIDQYKDSSIPGIGLGLSVAKLICEKLDYQLEIQSKINEYTRVTLKNIPYLVALS